MSTATAPQPNDRESILQFLSAIVPEGFIDFRAIDHEKEKKPVERFIPANQPEKALALAKKYSDAGYESYFGCVLRTGKSGKAKSCGLAHALFADIDFNNVPEDEARAKLAAFKQQPNIIVRSGNGLHCYWLLDTPIRLQKWILRQLAERLGGDLASTDVAHVLRIPGTLNHKYDPPRPVTIEKFDDLWGYEIEDFGFTEEADEPTSTQEKHPNTPASDHMVQRAKEWLADQPPAIEGKGGDNLTFKTAAHLVRDYGLNEDQAFELMDEWNGKCVPSWSDDELRDKIRNAQKYGSGEVGALDPVKNFAEVAEPCLSDDEIMETMWMAENGQKMVRLFDGDISEYANDEQADEALCRQIAFYTKNRVQIERIFGRSALGQRSEWTENEDYRERTIRKALEYYSNDLPTIKVSGGSLPSNVRDAERYLGVRTLQQPEKGVFKRAGMLVTIARTATPTEGKMRRAAGTLQIVSMRRMEILRQKITEVARWTRYNMREQKWVRIDAPKDVASTLLENHDVRDNTPPLTGIIEAPTLRADGSTLDRPGYDEATGLYFDPGDTRFPHIPQNPTKDEALAALNHFLEILAEFPFTDKPSRSVVIAYLITPVIRHVIRSAPMTVLKAPRPGSGKTLITTLAGYIATGRAPSLISQPRTPEEESKLILAVFLEGSQVTVIDNCELPLRGETLCTALTEPVIRGRVLGRTSTATVPTTTTWAATGNNIVIEGDLSSRVLLCSLDPGTDRPEERRFKLDLHKEVPRRRAELVAAALTIVRAYRVAGSPLEGKLKPLGRFEDWSSWVREPLVWLGMADPCETREVIEAADPVRNQLGNFLEAGSKVFGKKPFTVADVIKFVADPVNDEALCDAIQGIAEDHRGRLNPKKLGNYLEKYQNRIERGLRFRKTSDTYQNGRLWWIEQC